MCKRWNAMVGALAGSVDAVSGQKWKLLVEAAPVLNRFDDGKAVVAHLHGQHGSDAERDNILSALVRASRSGDGCGNLARDLLWLALWPGLTAIRRRLTGWGDQDEDELAAQITSTFAEVVARLEPTASMKVAATLLWNTRKYVSRILADGVAARGVEVRLDVDAIMNESGSAEADLADLLSDLVAHAGPDVELVLACVVEGLTMREAAERCQLPTEVVKKRMQRVIRRMRANVSANSARLDVPFSRKNELIGGEKRKFSSSGQRKNVGPPAGANPEAANVSDNDKAEFSQAERPHHRRRTFRSIRNHHRRIWLRFRAKCKAHGVCKMKAQTLPVAVLVAPVNERTLSGAEKVVAYCDVCRRWGERGSIHVCGENWSEHLLAVLATTGVSGGKWGPQ